jgi:hypothetical protein
MTLADSMYLMYIVSLYLYFIVHMILHIMCLTLRCVNMYIYRFTPNVKEYTVSSTKKRIQIPIHVHF